MMERDGAMVLFPVIFYDGERETHIGNVGVHPSMDFKVFQVRIGQMIGISYNNFTIYLIDGKKSKLSSECRKTLITGKVNFSLIVNERDCYFLVVLKRSRRDRHRKLYQNDLLFDEYLPAIAPPAKMMLLRRNQPEFSDLQFSGYSYNDRFQDLQIQRDNYINMLSDPNWNVNLNQNQNFGLQSPDPFPKLEEIYSAPEKHKILCQECMEAKKGDKAKFHICTYDQIVEGFRSMAGPVRRPEKVSR